MIPYKDDNPTRRFPYLTISLIVLNVVLFILTYATDPVKIIFSYGAVPSALISLQSTQPLHPLLTVFTAMFLHGGIIHVAGNMLYLWIFGDNIEDKLGPLRFLVFYFLSGLFAAYAHALTQPVSMVPMIGASGAISGILGAYVLLFPRARVYTVIFLGFFVQIVRIPALIVIGFWAIIQFLSGVGMGQGGVAWFAHVGGFVFGILTIKLFLATKRRGAKW